MDPKKREKTFEEAAAELGEAIPFDDTLRRLVNTPPKPMKASDRHRPEKAPNAEMERKRS